MGIVCGLHLGHSCAIALILCVLLSACVHNGESSDKGVRQYCPYFQNRAPNPQPSLDNCTWYKENACCLNEELTLVFSNLLPMVGANSKCVEVLNHLYCYVCSPDQSNFFNMDRLTVCEGSCNLIYSKCSDALLKGVALRELYTNGTELCAARRFFTAKAKTGQCFDFTKFFTKSSANTVLVRSSTALFLVTNYWLLTFAVHLDWMD